jgi:hypothetical protein
MKAASAHHIWPRLTAPPKLHPLIIPTATKLAAHIAVIVNIQSIPPMIIPLTGYASPFKTCVTSTAGKIVSDACCTAKLVVSPRRMETLCRYVVRDKTVAMPPPINREVLIRCLTTSARTFLEYVVVSDNSRLDRGKVSNGVFQNERSCSPTYASKV